MESEYSDSDSSHTESHNNEPPVKPKSQTLHKILLKKVPLVSTTKNSETSPVAPTQKAKHAESPRPIEIETVAEPSASASASASAAANVALSSPRLDINHLPKHMKKQIKKQIKAQVKEQLKLQWQNQILSQITASIPTPLVSPPILTPTSTLPLQNAQSSEPDQSQPSQVESVAETSPSPVSRQRQPDRVIRRRQGKVIRVPRPVRVSRNSPSQPRPRRIIRRHASVDGCECECHEHGVHDNQCTTCYHPVRVNVVPPVPLVTPCSTVQYNCLGYPIIRNTFCPVPAPIYCPPRNPYLYPPPPVIVNNALPCPLPCPLPSIPGSCPLPRSNNVCVSRTVTPLNSVCGPPMERPFL
jgi:hypothetical protein